MGWSPRGLTNTSAFDIVNWCVSLNGIKEVDAEAGIDVRIIVVILELNARDLIAVRQGRIAV